MPGKVFLFLLLLAPCVTPDVPVEWFPVATAAQRLYVATDTLPDDISPATIGGLFAYLGQQVQPQPESAFAPWLDDAPPVLVRFTDYASRAPFPFGTETYGGMTGWASWHCLPSAGLCRLLGASETPGDGVLVVLVAAMPSRAENLGLVAHELSHVLGSVDGPRCPYHPDYHPGQALPPDAGDAYWWYGVTGVFTLVPQGVVWDALRDDCAAGDALSVCEALHTILEVEAESLPG